ncbi:acetyl-CoA carboxylase biotin carboxyl carrier protein subunit [Psychroserpens sp. NJDZ02]|uniref:acetyl-CoA carboxylase biotin carboxyl carrier protein subunit n=1 Tax=Psychroserpens sp. NJDZ02 TaxID=2570561 RepID=UPI0010A7A41E|nr:acetyl-CoA carboxylase biotin carboxyl carrier protein subunit [Psychroserpens sp. NJDZ02]QCE42607.1 acetyl-CoA carboxylase biotin carboxyl carrier protein subunit [Psychroserpens sp. NJDZ02]
MSQKFNVKTNDLYQFEIDSDTVKSLDAVETKKDSFHLLENNKPFRVEVLASDFDNKSYQIKVNNNLYTVQIENQLDALIKALGFEVGASKIIDNIKAPMPGLILDIMVNPGDEVTVNTPLLILEAMKMENSIVSPRDGIIKSVTGTKGNTVDKGELLIEFE